VVNGESRRIRFHDYAEIYKIPGMYEKLFADMLECTSPDVVAGLLADAVDAAGQDMASVRVLDFGAGNGMVAEALAAKGVTTIVGVDLLPEARAAAMRDRPGLYGDYIAGDVTALDVEQHDSIVEAQLNCLTCVAALGFDDVPPAAFAAAFNYVVSSGWCAFNLRDRYVDEPSAFSRLLDRMIAEGVLVDASHVRYDHRLAVSGEPLEYDAVIARKTRDIPESWIG
jgi:SAM-dependent methyltransferase